MSRLHEILCADIAQQSKDDTVALLLSGGIDSLSVGIALMKSGKTVKPYTYTVEGFRSKELRRVEKLSRHFGWDLTVVTVPADVSSGFLELAYQHKCLRKVQFEVSYPLLALFSQIKEREIWTGWNADDHYGNTRRIVIEQARMKREQVSAANRKAHFDAWRSQRYESFDRVESQDTWWIAKRMAADHGKELLDPYAATSARNFFADFDHDTLAPVKKPFVRDQLRAFLSGLDDTEVNSGVNMQIGGRVNELFERLLIDLDINRFERKYTQVSALCRRWATEVANGLPRPPVSKRGLAPSQRNEPRRFTVISTFAGGGGSSLGYRLAGGSVLLANEFVEEAARTYRANFPDSIIDRRNIRDILADPNGVVGLLSRVGLRPGELDILDGSPPCCEFSVAGKGISDQSVVRSYSDTKQSDIASLPFDLVELAHRIRPKVVCFENVPALATRGAEVFELIRRALRRNYFVNSAVLVASDFEVPQKRRRLFVLGVRHDVGHAIGIDSDHGVKGLFPLGSDTSPSIRKAFAGLTQSAEEIEPWIRSAAMASLGTTIRLLPKNPPKHTRLRHLYPNEPSRFSLTRCAWDLPAPTLVVTTQRPDGVTGAIHPEENRKFSLPELKRLSGLPDDFVLTGTLAQAAERVCRMVPPPMTKAIATAVYDRVIYPYRELVR